MDTMPDQEVSHGLSVMEVIGSDLAKDSHRE
jgi:hypothetical protein